MDHGTKNKVPDLEKCSVKNPLCSEKSTQAEINYDINSVQITKARQGERERDYYDPHNK